MVVTRTTVSIGVAELMSDTVRVHKDIIASIEDRWKIGALREDKHGKDRAE